MDKNEILRVLSMSSQLDKQRIKVMIECEKIIGDIMSEKKVIRFVPSESGRRQLEMAEESQKDDLIGMARFHVYENETRRVKYDVYLPGFLYGTRPGSGYIDSVEMRFDDKIQSDEVFVNVFDITRNDIITISMSDMDDYSDVLMFIDDFLDKQ